MTRVAVTGASGFVGRRLLPLLAPEGHDVRVLTRLGSGYPPPPPNVDSRSGDVRSLETVRSLVQDRDVVIHLAATFRPEACAEETIVTGTRNMVRACREAGVSRLVYVSCLGADAAADSAFYQAKWKAEAIIRGAEESLPYTILRPSLVVGCGS